MYVDLPSLAAISLTKGLPLWTDVRHLDMVKVLTCVRSSFKLKMRYVSARPTYGRMNMPTLTMDGFVPPIIAVKSRSPCPPSSNFDIWWKEATRASSFFRIPSRPPPYHPSPFPLLYSPSLSALANGTWLPTNSSSTPTSLVAGLSWFALDSSGGRPPRLMLLPKHLRKGARTVVRVSSFLRVKSLYSL